MSCLLSLCMIVKDEENCIARCLNSVKHVVDEMIIVDTGSADQTVKICQSYGAHVYHFPWNGSFSDARNYGLARAAGDWILWLDADEEVDAEDAYTLRDVLDRPDNLLSIHLINYYGSKLSPDQSFEMAHTRLFRNYIGFKFEQNIHEMLNVKQVFASKPFKQTIDIVPIKIYHYGYLDDVSNQKQKLRRNLELLEKELEKDDHSPWIEYYIASEYYRYKQYNLAFEHINQAIIGFLRQALTPPSLLYRLKYSILIATGSIDGAWPGIERAIALYPDYVDLHFYKGLILFFKEMYVEALQAFEQCLDMGENNLQYLTLKGVGTFQAAYYKGCCLEQLGHLEEAARAYAEAGAMSPSFAPPLAALNRLGIALVE